MANKISGKDVVFQRSAVTIAQVTAIKWSGQKRDAVDASNVDSASNYREYIGGLLDGGEVTLSLIYDEADTGHIALKSDLESDTPGSYSIVFPSPISKTWTLPALVTSIGREIPFDGRVTCEVGLKITGRPTVA
jgi:predicted secreted protein